MRPFRPLPALPRPLDPWTPQPLTAVSFLNCAVNASHYHPVTGPPRARQPASFRHPPPHRPAVQGGRGAALRLAPPPLASGTEVATLEDVASKRSPSKMRTRLALLTCAVVMSAPGVALAQGDCPPGSWFCEEPATQPDAD